MPRVKRITYKEKKFAERFVANQGNAKQAAMESYNCSNKNMAGVIGCLSLKKPRVVNEIERLMEEKQITDEVMFQKLKEGMDATVVTQHQGEASETEIPDQDKRFKWWDAAAKIKKLYPAQETINKNLNLDVQLETMPKEEFANLLKGLLTSVKQEVKQEENQQEDD